MCLYGAHPMRRRQLRESRRVFRQMRVAFPDHLRALHHLGMQNGAWLHGHLRRRHLLRLALV